MDDTTTGPCPRCDCTISLARALTEASTMKLNEASQELAKFREDRDELLTQVVRLTADVRRLQAQLRDEERENAALRRRLREGGR
jgi:septal ring factor EnvC (AmiA/AmiB activator)